MRNWAWLVLFVASGCGRCGSGAGVVDAGSVRIHRSTDLKTAVFSAYPEFRGARVLEGGVDLVRTLDRPVTLEGAVTEGMRKNEFEISTDGGSLLATRPPYTLRIEGRTMTVSLPIVEADIGKLLNAPVTMTTEQLALWFPKPPGTTVVGEQFRLKLIYDSIDWRAGFLAWQMVELNTRGTWKVEAYPEGYERTRRPDGGGGGSPVAYSLALVDTNTTARIELQRDGGCVELTYLLRTEELR